ncbi:MAG: hypothetical protein CHACPFDD_04017 [Phycisphaerae bacterium]|nr:hypothetical protein [Phycisphaerae bacterium]
MIQKNVSKESSAPDPVPDSSRDGTGNTLRPMTPALLSQLFVVPALIVIVVLTCAMLVTLMFGWIGFGQREDLTRLVDKLAAGTGEKVVGVLLLPKEKELWLAALELANRLQNADREIPAEQRPALAARLADVLSKTAAAPQPSEATRNRITYIATALGRLRQPQVSAPTLVALLDSAEASTRAAAVRGLAELGRVSQTQAAAGKLAQMLADASPPELRIIIAAALGQIATPGDAAVIAALRQALADENEIRWNAALSLARLGDRGGLADVADMLSRDYWKSVKVRVSTDDDRTRPMNEAEISRNIRGALSALPGINDSAIVAAVEKLKSDPNLDVSKAATIMAGQLGAGGGPPGTPEPQ